MCYDVSIYCSKMLTAAGKLRELSQRTIDSELLMEVMSVTDDISWQGHMADNYKNATSFVVEQLQNHNELCDHQTGKAVSPKMLIEFLAELLENEAAGLKRLKFHIA